ncbi:hypothetical protein BDZ94DRAFT_1267298 [Collybia nuda]|uniref:Uncharacterized protein n=1 Tax=Collybia nuda TaxID=64659 RepID=A0A9P5Y263_9AGAR|nr:hypothetical protein BDZ94DRAFT_1267298 [Collybia nuda]
MAFQNTPRLVAAAFGVDLGWETTMPKLTWANLTDLAITEGSDLSPNVGHRILKHCPRIVQLVTLPSLKTLLLNLSFYDTVADFLQPLTLPYLSRLEVVWLSDTSPPPHWNHAAALSVISGFSRLVKLKIGLPIPGDYDTGPFLASISKVRKLDIGPLSRTTIRLLSSTEYLPYLQTLRAPITPKSTRAHLKMLEKRAEVGFKTRGVLVWPSSRVGKEFIANGDEKHLIEKMRDLLSSRIQQWM